jgi:hypothetical protein
MFLFLATIAIILLNINGLAVDIRVATYRRASLRHGDINMKLKLTKTIGLKTVKATIRLDDECKNGHEDFSITGEVYYKGRLESCGCCHEDILEFYPEFKIFIDLHLCQFDGTPMYAIENGFYHLENKQYHRVKSTLFCNDEELEILKSAKDKPFFRYLVNSLGLVDRWEGMAKEAISLLECQTGEKFISKATRPRPTVRMTADEMKTFIAEFIDTNFYSKQSIEKRERAKQKEIRLKRTNDLKETLQKNIKKLRLEHDFDMVFVKLGIFKNAILYNHNSTINFKWVNYENKLDENQIDLVCKELKKNKKFSDFKFTNENLGR